MSSHNAGDAFQRLERRPWEGARAAVYVSGGRLRVTVEVLGARIDLSWQEWGDLVATVGEAFTTLALREPDVLRAAADVDTQTRRLRSLADALRGKRLISRTLDKRKHEH